MQQDSEELSRAMNISIFLSKGAKFFCLARGKKEPDERSLYVALEGYRLSVRTAYTGRRQKSNFAWVTDHVNEILILWNQIGLRNTLRFIRYARQPKVMYVDAIKLQNQQNGEVSVFRSDTGLPLYNAYDEDLMLRLGCYVSSLEGSDVANTFSIADLESKKRPLFRQAAAADRQHYLKARSTPTSKCWALVGAGSFCASILAPSIINAGGQLRAVCSNVGASAELLARIYGVESVYDSIEDMLDAGVATNLLIATPGYMHPEHIKLAINARMKIYSEKPVAVDPTGVSELMPYADYPQAMVGFNRRFAPAVDYVMNTPGYREKTGSRVITYVALLGEFSVAMATKKIGGGTTVGACCHYIDLLEYLAQSRVSSFQIAPLSEVNAVRASGESFSSVFKMENGAVCTLVFVRSNQHPGDVRERIIISGEQENIIINDFSRVIVNGKSRWFRSRTKGWMAAMQHFHSTPNLADSDKTPTLATGIRNAELALEMDKVMHQYG
ncbi:MAG: Gfo/Idh/MocA family oxidoreductase [Halioglobus sp.]|nr:Gfo/Idh/MocA family oxidoreductase [Halioglobus sp.]